MRVIGIDLGGTKIAAALVNEKGKILVEAKVPTVLGDWKALKKQLVEICQDFGLRGTKAVGIGSAGPLHAPSGKLLDPTNFGWKNQLVVPIVRDLQKSLRRPVVLENDAAAAALAEHWKGKAKPNSIVVTLGTGVGVGVIANGRLVRGGRTLHPEGGHLLLRPGDTSAPCGCGNFGCAEAFLSGKNFSARASRILKKELSGADLRFLAVEKEPAVLALFEEYSDLLANFLHNLVVLYYPEEIIFTGSFSAAAPIFFPRTEKTLHSLLERRLKSLPILPKLRISRLGNEAGMLGAAYIALKKNYAS